MRPVSDESERRLTGAIERAASAVAAGGGDCSGTLARALLAEGVDGRFAKVASDSFNKRLTVLRLSRLDDERRPESFPLADAEEVRAAMGMPTMAKAASLEPAAADLVRGEFKLHVLPGPMEKAASELPERAPRQGILDGPDGLERLERQAVSLLESQTAFVRGAMAKLASMECDERRLRDGLAEELSRAGDGVRQRLANAYGDRLAEAMPELGAARVRAGVPEGSPAFAKAAALMEAHEAVADMREVMERHAHGLEEFVAGAAALAMVKEAATEPDRASSGALSDLLGGTADLVGNVLQGPVKNTIDALAGVGTAVEAQRARHNSLRPDAVITSRFLTGDRYLDRLISWSDVAADPALAIYPAEQVFSVTQQLMDMHPALERPDQRVYLKALAGQILAQNGRIGPQDYAASAVSLKDISRAVGSAAMAGKAVEALDKETAPDAELGVFSEGLGKALTELPKRDPGAARVARGVARGVRNARNEAVYGSMSPADSLSAPDQVRMVDALRDRAKTLGYTTAVTRDPDGTYRVLFSNGKDTKTVAQMLEAVRGVRV